MIRIEIKSTELKRRELTSKQGRPMVFHEQEAWAYIVDSNGQPQPYPQRMVINIDADHGQKAYPTGFHTPSPDSLFIDRFNTLKIGRLKLVPIGVQGAAQPARAA